MWHERIKNIIYRKTSEGIHNYYDLKTQVPAIILEEISRSLKQRDRIKVIVDNTTVDEIPKDILKEILLEDENMIIVEKLTCDEAYYLYQLTYKEYLENLVPTSSLFLQNLSDKLRIMHEKLVEESR